MLFKINQYFCHIIFLPSVLQVATKVILINYTPRDRKSKAGALEVDYKKMYKIDRNLLDMKYNMDSVFVGR